MVVTEPAVASVLPGFSPSRGEGKGRRPLLILALAAALFILLGGPILAQSLPSLTGRVVDDAGIIDASTEADLVARLEAFEQRSSDQIVVATVQNLGGEAIEPYANRLFRAWGLGQAGEDNGILLLVAVDDRRMRIEVGYGLEGTLTDLHARLIIENTMVPAFRAGDFSGGISQAVDDIIRVLEGNAAELEARAERNLEEGWDFDVLIPAIFIILWCSVFFGTILVAILVPRFGRKTGAKRYRWMGMDWDFNSSGSSGSSGGSSWSSGSSSSGFSGGGGSSGGGGASGSW